MLRYYSCPKCGDIRDFRKDTKIISNCPTCKSKIKQQYNCNFKLVGSGFYSTDNKRGENNDR